MPEYKPEPDPVPTEAQKKVREQIASTVKQPPKDVSLKEGDVPLDHQAPASQQPNPNTQPEAQKDEKGNTVNQVLEPKKD